VLLLLFYTKQKEKENPEQRTCLNMVGTRATASGRGRVNSEWLCLSFGEQPIAESTTEGDTE